MTSLTSALAFALVWKSLVVMGAAALASLAMRLVARLAPTIGLSSEPPLRRVPNAAMPMAWGILRPVVMLNSEFSILGSS